MPPFDDSKPPAITVGLPVFNGEKFLAGAMKAILAQTFADFELIFADNASTDGSLAIARNFAACDARVQIHTSDRNRGLAWNHNRVVEQARGRYLKWAAADDICQPDFLLRCFQALEADPKAVLAYPKTQFMDESGRMLDIVDPGWHLPGENPAERLRFALEAAGWVNSIMGLIRVDALRKTRLMPAYPGGDFRLLSELALLGKFLEIPEPLFLRRLHVGASSQHATDGVSPDADWLVGYWQGEEKAATLTSWNLARDQFRIVLGSPLSWREKFSLLSMLLRGLRWKRQLLWNDLRRVLFPGAKAGTHATENGATPKSARAGSV